MAIKYTFYVVLLAVFMTISPAITRDLTSCPPDHQCAIKCHDSSGKEYPCKVCRIDVRGMISCECPAGHIGDGLRNGKGCSAESRKEDNKIPGKQSVWTIYYIVIPVGVLALIAIFIFVKEVICKRFFFKDIYGDHLRNFLEMNGIKDFEVFTLRELKNATNNFSKKNILGEGAEGVVFKGTLNERELAIKKLLKVEKGNLEQFSYEVKLLMNLDHPNVIRLLGCCFEDGYPILVYAFAGDRNLGDLIHGRKGSSELPLDCSLKIAADIASALNYLHTGKDQVVMHRDVKPNNIILDSNNIPRLGDFGISKVLPPGKTHLTTKVHGTPLYIDPYYEHMCTLRKESDTYSYGVLLLEMLTRLGLARSEENDGMSLSDIILNEEKRNLVINKQVVRHANREQYMKAISLSLRCLDWYPHQRPDMGVIEKELNELLEYSS